MRPATYLWIYAVSAAIVFLFLLVVSWGYLMQKGAGAIITLLFLSLLLGMLPAGIARRAIGVDFTKRR